MGLAKVALQGFPDRVLGSWQSMRTVDEVVKHCQSITGGGPGTLLLPDGIGVVNGEDLPDGTYLYKPNGEQQTLQ